MPVIHRVPVAVRRIPVTPTSLLIGGAVGGVMVGSALGRDGAGMSILLGGLSASLAAATMVFRNATLGTIATVGFGASLALTGVSMLGSED